MTAPAQPYDPKETERMLSIAPIAEDEVARIRGISEPWWQEFKEKILPADRVLVKPSHKIAYEAGFYHGQKLIAAQLAACERERVRLEREVADLRHALEPTADFAVRQTDRLNQREQEIVDLKARFARKET